ncbi:hypothetical protein ANTQUA_LOCUS9300 [Anthophora quadrimaculata]
MVSANGARLTVAPRLFIAWRRWQRDTRVADERIITRCCSISRKNEKKNLGNRSHRWQTVKLIPTTVSSRTVYLDPRKAT